MDLIFLIRAGIKSCQDRRGVGGPSGAVFVDTAGGERLAPCPHLPLDGDADSQHLLPFCVVFHF